MERNREITATERLDALDKEIGGIETEIDTLTEDHAKAVQAGDDGKADRTHAKITDARERMETAQARRTPLERAVEAEQEAERAKLAEELTRDADGRLEALETAIAEASKAAKKLAEAMDAIDPNAALHWAVAARKAFEAGGSPARRHLAGIDETLDSARLAARKIGHVADDFQRRSVQIPVQTRTRAA